MGRSRMLLSAAATTLALTLGTGVAAAPAHAEDVAPGTGGFIVMGHGYGHGHGMSQYGAQGAATQGRSWRDIVGFYYPGTKIKRGGGTIKVLITAATEKSLVVDAQNGLRLKQVGTRTSWKLDQKRPRATRWRITPQGQRSVVTYKAGGGWRKLTSVKGDLEFSAGRFPVTLRLPGHGKASYRGALRSVERQTVNVLPLDSYLRGVVAREVPAEWPAEAVRAQAVAARSYAAYEREAATTTAYDICDNESCQVYGGADDEHPQSDEAVRKTRGKILTYDGTPAFTQFSSSNGGWSTVGSAPYLVAQADPFEASSTNPYATWGPVTYTRQEIEAQWPQVGTLTDLSFTRDGNGDYGGWVTSVTVTGSAGSTTLTGDAFRQALGLRSAYLQFQSASQKQVADALVARLAPWSRR